MDVVFFSPPLALRALLAFDLLEDDFDVSDTFCEADFVSSVLIGVLLEPDLSAAMLNLLSRRGHEIRPPPKDMRMHSHGLSVTKKDFCRR